MFQNIITNVKNMGSYFIEFQNTVSQERDGEHGLSHLVEHCMCEKIKKLDKKFSENGITWNAATSRAFVIYFMSGLTRSINKYIEQFTKDILTYEITEEVFEREKKVVISEYLMYYDDDSERFMNNWYRHHYNFTGELGLLTDLQNITYEKFMQFKNRVFSKPNNIFYVHSKNTKDYILKQNIEYNDKFNTEINYTEFAEHYNKYPMEYYSTGISDQYEILIGMPYVHENKEQYYIDQALISMFNSFMCGGLSAYLYQTIREKSGLTYHIGACPIAFDNYKQSYCGFTLGTNKDNYQKVIKLINKSLSKLVKNITLRKFNSIIKSFTIKHKIEENTCYSNYSLLCDPDLAKIFDIILNKKITYEMFVKFAENFANNYKIYNDKDYIKNNENELN